MVRTGHAWAYGKYALDYVAQEHDARAHKRGIWQAATPTAQTFRSAETDATAHARRHGCNIKGNITKRGRIYHTPSSPWYDQTRINQRKGERWFCNEAEARAAGWRAAKSG